MKKRSLKHVVSVCLVAAFLMTTIITGLPGAASAAGSMIPAKPEGATNFITAGPDGITGDMAGSFAYADGTLNIVGKPSTIFRAEYTLDSALTAASEYVISVDFDMPEGARYSADHGPIVIFRKNTDGNYLGLWMQGAYCYLVTYTLNGDNTFSPTFGEWKQVSLLPDGSKGTLKLHSKPNGVWAEMYDQNGVLQTLQNGSTYASWGIYGGAPAFALSTNGSQATFSNAEVYDPNEEVEDDTPVVNNSAIPAEPNGATNFITAGPDGITGDMAGSFAYTNGTLNIVGKPSTIFRAEYTLDSALKATDEYVISVDFDMPAGARYSDGHGPIVMFRKNTEGNYLGLWMQGTYCYLQTYTLNADNTTFTPAGGDWRLVSLLPDGSKGTLKLYTTTSSVLVEVYNEKGVLQAVDGTNTNVTWGINGGAPALVLSTNGSQATFSNAKVYNPNEVFPNTVTVDTVENGTITIPSVDCSDVAAGTIVPVVVTPEAGYQLKAGSLRYVETLTGNSYPIAQRAKTDAQDEESCNTFLFSMPATSVTITAEFVSNDGDANFAVLGASYKDQDLRFVSRAYRNTGKGNLIATGNYVLRADSPLGKQLKDGQALTSEQFQAMFAGVGAVGVADTSILNANSTFTSSNSDVMSASGTTVNCLLSGSPVAGSYDIGTVAAEDCTVIKMTVTPTSLYEVDYYSGMRLVFRGSADGKFYAVYFAKGTILLFSDHGQIYEYSAFASQNPNPIYTKDQPYTVELTSTDTHITLKVNDTYVWQNVPLDGEAALTRLAPALTFQSGTCGWMATIDEAYTVSGDKMGATTPAKEAVTVVKQVPTTVLNDRCTDYVDYAVRLTNAGADAYKDVAYVCVTYVTYKDAEGNETTEYSAPCIRSYRQISEINVVAAGADPTGVQDSTAVLTLAHETASLLKKK